MVLKGFFILTAIALLICGCHSQSLEDIFRDLHNYRHSLQHRLGIMKRNDDSTTTPVPPYTLDDEAFIDVAAPSQKPPSRFSNVKKHNNYDTEMDKRSSNRYGNSNLMENEMYLPMAEIAKNENWPCFCYYPEYFEK